MSEPAVLNVHIDGAARGNPGPAAYAFVITRGGAPAIEEKGCIGSTTNNLAEYTALLRALERAAQLGGGRVLVHSDSELLVKQMNGEYRVKNPNLRAIYEQVKQLTGRFEQVTFRHVPRAQNSLADRLCNEALDGEDALGGHSSPRTAVRGHPDPRLAALREDALACLQAVAASWAQSQKARPTPEEVWDQLWSILEDHGVLRRS